MRELACLSIGIAISCASAPLVARAAESSGANAELHAIVVAHADTREGADTFARRFRNPSNLRMVDEVVRVSEAWPVVVSGEELSGLGPGFHVVLGYCPAGTLTELLALLNVFYPEATQRTIGAPREAACPRLKSNARVRNVRTLTSKDQRLSVAAILFDPDPDEEAGRPPKDPDPDRGRWKVIAGLFSTADGRFLDSRTFRACANLPDMPHEPRCTVELGGDDGQVVVTTDFHLGQEAACVGGLHVFRAETTIAFGRGTELRLQDRILEQVVDSPLCSD